MKYRALDAPKNGDWLHLCSRGFAKFLGFEVLSVEQITGATDAGSEVVPLDWDDSDVKVPSVNEDAAPGQSEPSPAWFDSAEVLRRLDAA